MLHSALAAGLSVRPAHRSSIVVSGPPGTESLALALYRDRAHIRALLDSHTCDCGQQTPSVDEPYAFGQLICLARPFPFTREQYQHLVAFKNTHAERRAQH